LEGLAEVHPRFARWNKKARLRAAANKAFCTMPPKIEELDEIFAKGRRYKDVPPEPWPQMGYSVSAWNGRDGLCGVSWSLDAGCFGLHLPEPNDIFMQLGSAQPGNEDFINATVLKRSLMVIARAWEPDWGVVETWAYKGRSKDAAGFPLHPWGGWITYLAPHYTSRIAPPTEVISERVPGGGLLLLASEEPFTVQNPAHVAAADAIQRVLAPVQQSLADLSRTSTERNSRS
jgi:Immunity protein 52